MDAKDYAHNTRKIVRIRNPDAYREQIVPRLREYPSERHDLGKTGYNICFL